jgi:hypothetical protein
VLTEVKTAADVLKLPFHVRNALKAAPVRGLRRDNEIERAARKAIIQVAVVKAIRELEISLDLGREILTQNRAYGPKGKRALAEFGRA